jgi:hypothetical protein
MASDDFTGLWRCSYWYPSNTHVGDDVSEYQMKAHRDGDNLVFESVANAEGSYMFVRLTLRDEVATGAWHETTSPTGEFKGAVYSGSGQLVVNPDTNYMEGKWAGAGFDHKLKRMRIYSGNWEIAPIKSA